MKEIKQIVDKLKITDKRNKLIENNNKILKLKTAMSKLALFKNVAHYAYNYRLIEYLEKEETEESLFEIIKLEEENAILLADENVYLYKILQDYIKILEKENSDYYQTIQTKLRYELMSLNHPNIYIYQGKLDPKYKDKAFMHIIDYTHYFTDGNYPDISIMPYDELDSNRQNRHFYNGVSFKYLEELTKDYSFDLDNKNIGRVKILTKKTNIDML